MREEDRQNAPYKPPVPEEVREMAADSSDRERVDDDLRGEQAEHNVFGDQHLLLATMFVLLLHILNYVMRPPCTC